jgi:site-specific recombinase XerD
MDELAYHAADLPAAIRRDVAFALGLRSGAGIEPYEEGLFARLIREDMARTPCGKKVTFREVVVEWLAGKQAGVMNDEIKARTVTDAKDCIAPALAAFGGKFVSEILKKDIENLLNKFTSYRRRNIHMRINEVFRYCQENRILGTAPENNPCYGIKWPKIKERLPEPILVDDARKLFALAVQTEDQLGCTAWIAFRMFEALRDAEASKTTFATVKGINVPRGFIHLPWEVAKKRERMVFFDPDQCPDPKLRDFIPKNLKVILNELPLRTDGKLAPNRREIDMFKSYARHCGIKWQANGLRAGFASHHFALYQDAGAASKLMGHLASDGGVEVFYNHYYKFADYEAGKAYFEIGLNGLNAAGAAFLPPLSIDEFLAIKAKNEAVRSPRSKKN